ncbi:MAG: hypothetical protein WA659_04250, partial [Candidatus Aquirickettsiella sp.]
MKQFEQQKKTVLEKKLDEKIQRLEEEIKKLPAYTRRKKDEEHWESFFTFLVFSALVGILMFGVGGWMAVALSGTLLTLIIVESGLFSSFVIGFSAWPIYNAYLWIRDLFSSEKIKAQNKDYDHFHNNLQRLKKLAAEKNDLSSKINLQLNKALQCLPSEFIAQEKVGFMQLSLKEQIQQLEQQEKKHPAYSRNQKIKANWGNLSLFSMLSMFFGAVLIYGRIILSLLLPTLL